MARATRTTSPVMWIHYTRTTDTGDPVIRRLKRPELSKPVYFSDNGKANVPEADAQFLIDHSDHIEPVSDSDADADSDDVDSEADTESAAADADGDDDGESDPDADADA